MVALASACRRRDRLAVLMVTALQGVKMYERVCCVEEMSGGRMGGGDSKL